MRIAVFGCGAMGSIYAALLSSSGHKVIIIDRNQEHVAAINEKGLRVKGASGDRCLQIKAYTKPPEIEVDLLVIAVKAAHVDSSYIAKALVKSKGLILTIQNGLGSADIVAKIFGEDRVIVGVAEGFGASLKKPGVSHHNDMKAIHMGTYTKDINESLLNVVEVFKQSGFDCDAVSDIKVVQWEKLICNVAYSGPCALTGMTLGEVLDDPLIGQVSRAAAVEAWEVARKRNIPINIVDPIDYVQKFAERMRKAKPSVLLDIEAGRRSEIEVINGAVQREAEQVGAVAPVNSIITALVQSLEIRTTT